MRRRRHQRRTGGDQPLADRRSGQGPGLAPGAPVDAEPGEPAAAAAAAASAAEIGVGGGVRRLSGIAESARPSCRTARRRRAGGRPARHRDCAPPPPCRRTPAPAASRVKSAARVAEHAGEMEDAAQRRSRRHRSRRPPALPRSRSATSPSMISTPAGSSAARAAVRPISTTRSAPCSQQPCREPRPEPAEPAGDQLGSAGGEGRLAGVALARARRGHMPAPSRHAPRRFRTAPSAANADRRSRRQIDRAGNRAPDARSRRPGRARAAPLARRRSARFRPAARCG